MASAVRKGLGAAKSAVGSLVPGKAQQLPERVLMCGLDSSGKTTILYKLACGFDMDVPDVPTIGVNVETITAGSNTRVTIWDVGGGHKQKHMWKNYAANEDGGVSGVIFVHDCCDDIRIEIARTDLSGLLKLPGTQDVPILVFSNKADQETGKIDKDTLSDRIGMRSAAMRNRRWRVEECCALTGEGLQEGIDWLCSQMGGSMSPRRK